MSDSTDSAPTLDQLMQLAEVTTEMRSLLLLDAAWTGAEKLAPMNAGNTSGIVSIGDRVDRSLATLGDSTSFLRDLFSAHQDWFDAQIETALQQAQLDDDLRANASARLKGESGSFAGNAVELVDDLAARIPMERTSLRAKIDRIRGGGDVITDIDASTACTVGTLFGMGALTACVVLEVPTFCISGGADLLLVMALC
jgi:hypothetical protein